MMEFAEQIQTKCHIEKTVQMLRPFIAGSELPWRDWRFEMRKKRGFFILMAGMLAVLTAQPLPCSAVDSYEWEDGKIYDTGTEETTVVTLSGADGGKAVRLLDAGDSVTLHVSAAAAGTYTLSIRYSQPYDEGGKLQNVLINGDSAGSLSCDYTGEGEFKVAEIPAVLKAGSNQITVESSWGWTYLDSLNITERSAAGTSVSAELANPKSTQKTQSLYAFLCDTYGKHVIAGQQESTWMGSDDYEFNIIKNASGKMPALRGLDYMGQDFAGCNRRAKAWAAKGGIVTICWHCGDDFKGSHTEAMNAAPDWSKILTPGTNEYNKLIAGMDQGAKALKELQDADVPVIWRPFHEFDGAWFWWGKGGAENFKKLWRLMYDRYTNEWGLNNLIWSLGYSGDVKDGWYPGDEYVDIIGADTYVNHTNSLVSMYQRTASVAQKPVCLHENGPIPDPEKMKADGAKWLWFMTWHTSFIDSDPINTASYLRQVYNSDYMLTLDELPDIYNYASAVKDEPKDEPQQNQMKGDLNGDGKIDNIDVALLLQHLLTKQPLDQAQASAADLDGNKLLAASDLTALKQLVRKQQPQEPPKPSYQFDPAKKYAEYAGSYKNAASQAGKIVKETYNGINGSNTLNVYLPYGYDHNKQYNIFYFMHGMGDSENSLFYNDNGESVRLLDNMIRNGDIDPMIIVTPTFNKVSADTFYNAENFYKEFRASVVPFVEGKYSTYAKSTSEADLKASRMHRAYGGFSMGSVSTWAVFENCVDMVGYFLPMSGAHHWGTGNPDANALAGAVEKAGLKKNEYFIMSATGTSDFAVDALRPQIESMKKLSQFEYTSDFSKGNLWFILADGGQHSWYYVRQYLYNGLPFFFR